MWLTRILFTVPVSSNRPIFKTKNQILPTCEKIRILSETLMKMDLVREFLESSTVHGLSYISTSKVGAYVLLVRSFWLKLHQISCDVATLGNLKSFLFDFNAFCSLIMFCSATVLQYKPTICAIIIFVLFRQELKSVFGLSLFVSDSPALGFSSADPFRIGRKVQYPPL